MTELLTSAQMRAIEQAAIASGEVTALELMERAGRGVVEAIFEEWPELKATSHRAVVLCGPGNNGGDGFVVARLLKEWGWEVEVFLYGDPERLPPDARMNYERWREMGEVNAFPKGFFLPRCDFLIDALFGTGLSRPIPSEISYVFASQHKSKGSYKCVAVDLPSGICADSGRSLEIGGRADLTVTFHRAKRGHYLAEGAACCGKVRVKSIGLRVPAFKSISHLMAFVTDPNRQKPSASEVKADVEGRRAQELAKVALVEGKLSEVKKTTVDPNRRGQVHKYSHGHALILAGPSGRGGAARLAARGALRIGAGVVTVGCPPEALVENAARLDAVMLKPIADDDVLARVLEDRRINALCLGPGMGTGTREVDLVSIALATARSAVLDADALTILAGEPELVAALHEGCVLTPHAGEFARLFPDISEKLNAPAAKGPAFSKVDACREAAKRAGCVVLYKGPDTVIAGPDGRCAINSAQYDRAAPWLATAGSGDVLAGFITGLLARGFAPFDAACTGAWLHVECALEFGPGLIAEDLPEQLPAVFRRLLT